MTILLLLTFCMTNPMGPQEQLDRAVELGKPLVAHVVVALVDNDTQGVLPVPPTLGNGRDARNNLYWGALYGVKTFMTKRAGWRRLVHDGKTPDGVLERLVLTKDITRNGKTIPVYLVAEAWNGQRMEDALYRFYNIVGGKDKEILKVTAGDKNFDLECAGNAHITGFVGHNGMMDHDLLEGPKPEARPFPTSAIVLACLSESYFHKRLENLGAYSLLLTNGLMAPEAYTLNAAVTAWFEGQTPAQTHEAAAAAYHKYQKCGMKGARRLFYTQNR